jgi:hypothetical protein
MKKPEVKNLVRLSLKRGCRICLSLLESGMVGKSKKWKKAAAGF